MEFESFPSTSQSTPTLQSTPKPRHQPFQMDQDEGLGSGSDLDSTIDRSSFTSIEDTQDQHSNSRTDDISKRVQDLIGRTNESRAMDQKIMDEFQDRLMAKVTENCEQMKEHMYTVYEENSQAMQAMLQELTETLESCSKLSVELQGASKILAGINKGLTPEP